MHTRLVCACLEHESVERPLYGGADRESVAEPRQFAGQRQVGFEQEIIVVE